MVASTRTAMASPTPSCLPVEAQPVGRCHPADSCRQWRQLHDDAHREQPPACHHLPSAQLRIYRDSGMVDQYRTLFADHVNASLNGG
jgi:hypothetical protein